MTESTNINAKKQKLVAIVNSTAPFSSTNGRDALDLALIFGAYEQATSLFFQGDGVWQLTDKQDTTLIHSKNYLKTLAALKFYDIENIYACQHALTQRGLTDSPFIINNVSVLTQQAFNDKLHLHHAIFRF